MQIHVYLLTGVENVEANGDAGSGDAGNGVGVKDNGDDDGVGVNDNGDGDDDGNLDANGDGLNDEVSVNGDRCDDFLRILLGVTQPALVELCMMWL